MSAAPLVLERPVRVYACDIDGCLAAPGHSAYDLARLAAIADLNRSSERDATVPALTLVTGRPHAYVDAMTQALAVRLPASFENGAGLATRRPYRAWLTPEAEAGKGAIDALARLLDARDDVFAQLGKVASLSVFPTDPARPLADVTALLEDLVARHGLTLDLDPSTDCINVLAPGVDKAIGFRALCAAADVDPLAVVGLGDMPGDLPWLRLCGASVAPAGADPTVRAEVTHPSALPDVAAALATYEALVASNRALVG